MDKSMIDEAIKALEDNICNGCDGKDTDDITDFVIQELTKIKSGEYVEESYLHLMLEKQKKSFKDSLLSDEEIAKILHSFDAISSDNKKLDILWNKILDENRRKEYRELAKALSSKIARPVKDCKVCKHYGGPLSGSCDKGRAAPIDCSDWEEKTKPVDREKIKKILKRIAIKENVYIGGATENDINLATEEILDEVSK